MTGILIVVLLLMFNQMNAAKEGQFHTDYLSKEKTGAINGIFVIFVFLRHVVQYIQLGGTFDAGFMKVDAYLNQLIVVSFMFYSGYGMMESVKKKKFLYVKSIMQKRFWVLLLNLNLVLCLFYIEGRFIGKTFTLKNILLSTFGWESLGNSSWYIFAILSIYIMFFVAFFVIKFTDNTKVYYLSAALLTIMIIAFVYFQMKMDRDGFMYNTVIIFALGVWWSLLKNIIEKVVMKNDIIYLFVMMIVVGIYCFSYFRRWKNGIEGYTVWAVAFAVLMILVTMKVSFFNPVLSWFGNHVFSIYILQRLPMNLFQYLGFNESHKYMFVICSFAVTVVMAVVFDKISAEIVKLLFNRKKTTAVKAQ